MSSAAGTAPSTRYRADIDGLRALAVTFVIVFHYFPDGLQGGYAGVDVFFVISGFLITRIIAREIGEQRFSFGQFYARRARRIFPALSLVLLFTLGIGHFCLPPGELARLGMHAAGGAAFVPNLIYASEVGYFDPAPEAKPLLHLWSLGIEEQFYVVWPALLLWFSRRRAWVPTLALALLSFLLCLFYIDTRSPYAFYSPLSRFWELLIGALLALLVRREAPDAAHGLRWVRAAASVGGLLLLLWAAFSRAERSEFPGLLALPPTLGAALLIWAGPTAPAGRLLAQRPLVAIGVISYPLYLWHWPLYCFARMRADDALQPSTLVGLACASALLALASHRLVEHPIRFGKLSQRGVAIASSALGLCFVTGAATYLQDGFPGRMPPSMAAIVAWEHYEFRTDARVGTCWLNERSTLDEYAPECFVRNPDEVHDLLLWGDSHAGRLYPGLREVLDPARQIGQLTRRACAPLLGRVAITGCKDSNAGTLREIQSARPHTVVLFANWVAVDRSWPAGSSAVADLDRTLAAVVQARVPEVLVLGQFPLWRRPLPSLLHWQWTAAWGAHVPARLSGHTQPNVAEIDARLAERAARAGVEFASVRDVLCNGDGCMTHVPGQPTTLITWDEGHLTTPGGRYLSRKLLEAGHFGM